MNNLSQSAYNISYPTISQTGLPPVIEEKSSKTPMFSNGFQPLRYIIENKVKIPKSESVVNHNN